VHILSGLSRRNLKAMGVSAVMVALAGVLGFEVTASAFSKSAGQHRALLFRPHAAVAGTRKSITMNSVPPQALRGLGLAFEGPQDIASPIAAAQAEQAASIVSRSPMREAVLAVVHSLHGDKILDGRRLWVISFTPPATDWSVVTGQEIHPTVLLAFVDSETGKLVESSQYAGRQQAW